MKVSFWNNDYILCHIKVWSCWHFHLKTSSHCIECIFASIFYPLYLVLTQVFLSLSLSHECLDECACMQSEAVDLIVNTVSTPHSLRALNVKFRQFFLLCTLYSTHTWHFKAEMLECQALCKIIVSGIVALLSIQDLKHGN